MDEKGNVLFFQLDVESGGGVLCFNVFRTPQDESFIVYLTSRGDVLFYALDLTCIECRLFSRHAQDFVANHPFWKDLSSKQRSQLIEYLMSAPPMIGKESENNDTASQ